MKNKCFKLPSGIEKAFYLRLRWWWTIKHLNCKHLLNSDRFKIREGLRDVLWRFGVGWNEWVESACHLEWCHHKWPVIADYDAEISSAFKDSNIRLFDCWLDVLSTKLFYTFSESDLQFRERQRIFTFFS